jgi:hypothetical protein
MDLFTYEVVDDILYFKIIELKIGPIDADAIFQIIRYFTFMHMYTQDQFKDVKWELILVGSDHTTYSLDISGIGVKISFYEFSFGFDGLFFKNGDYGELKFNDGRFGEFNSQEINDSIKIFSLKLKDSFVQKDYIKASIEE